VILVQTKGVPAVLLIMFGGEYSSQDKEMAKDLVLTSHGVQIIQHNLRTHKVQAEMVGLVMNL
jgi:hypothetical protein